ncbi:hypothetical protein A2483_01605 [Candidatus Peregrinibacteria bacterium RIFOXYC2_FULL_33_13]|nr:MAG: hypothetical protein A2483_01605 [Candidatus Peregrinibacteria bacterium RIFOXYC2_FULL_33_13]
MYIEDVKEKTLYSLIEKNLKKVSSFYTNSRISYVAANIYYNHKTTNHSKGEFAREEVHSNTIEQIWGDFKRNY